MGIRETINKNPTGTAAVTAGIILIALVFILWQACSGGGRGGTALPGKAYFTIDDGKTYFPDDASKIPPFPKDGKQAVRAHVFTCDGGKNKFVGYLEMYTDQDKMMIEQSKKGTPGAQGMPFSGYAGQALVKKPGDKQWVRLMPGTTEMYARVVQVQCPNGGSQESLERVYPE